MHNPIILETDFGYDDPYTGIMKGVIKTINSNAEIIDLTQGIPPFDINAGAYVLYTSYKFFPENSIFTVVIDPGVGSSRKPILAKACKRYFVGPDNGVLYSVIRSCYNNKSLDFIKVINSGMLLNKVSMLAGYFDLHLSNTFHGRDLFAPAAALVSMGEEITEFAPTSISLSDIVKYELIYNIEKDGLICFRPIYADRFGNVALSTVFKDFVSRHKMSGKVLFITSEGDKFTGVIGSTFSDVPSGSIVLYPNSFGFLEIAINKGSAAKLIGKPELICFKN
ncbi:MAG: SAM-dependent chlorinase/fluorinase [Desulfurococcales archaeon]|nr:SAM-dependent chlorinase/fluorinase [Desulfurococcales archaeon]